MVDESYPLEFMVSIFLGYKDTKNICITVNITDDEYVLLKKCYFSDEDVQAYPGLENLCERIKFAVQNEFCPTDMDSGERSGCDDILYRIEIPDEIAEEYYPEEEDEDEDPIDWNDYRDFPFAMEIVNDEIISLTPEFQKEILNQILNKLQVTSEELITFLSALAGDEMLINEKLKPISSFEYDVLAEILGFDEEEKDFSPGGIGFLDSGYGWETVELLKTLGIVLQKDIDYGTHGHDTNGVIYFAEE